MTMTEAQKMGKTSWIKRVHMKSVMSKESKDCQEEYWHSGTIPGRQTEESVKIVKLKSLKDKLAILKTKY